MQPDCFICFIEENYSPEKRRDFAFLEERAGEFYPIKDMNDKVPLCFMCYLDTLEFLERKKNAQAEKK
jgi:hypothetical protein